MQHSVAYLSIPFLYRNNAKNTSLFRFINGHVLGGCKGFGVPNFGKPKRYAPLTAANVSPSPTVCHNGTLDRFLRENRLHFGIKSWYAVANARFGQRHHRNNARFTSQHLSTQPDSPNPTRFSDQQSRLDNLRSDTVALPS